MDICDSFFVSCQILFFIGCARGVRLTELLVPVLADPRNELTLDCRFDMESDELNSVKWYKDDQEFFRYTPRQQPHFMAFPVAGVHLVPPSLADSTTSSSSNSASPCNTHQCTVRLTQLSTAHSSGSYKCEVSTEAPAFRVAFDAANVTVAAVGRADPQVDGLRPVYTLGELVFANCTSAPADPAPHISWLLNGKPAPSIALGQPRTSRPDIRGLVTRSLMLRFHVERRHFVEPAGTLELRCVVSMPWLLAAPSPKVTVVTVALRDPSRNTLSNQKLKWPSNRAVDSVRVFSPTASVTRKPRTSAPFLSHNTVLPACLIINIVTALRIGI